MPATVIWRARRSISSSVDATGQMQGCCVMCVDLGGRRLLYIRLQSAELLGLCSGIELRSAGRAVFIARMCGMNHKATTG